MGGLPGGTDLAVDVRTRQRHGAVLEEHVGVHGVLLEQLVTSPCAAEHDRSEGARHHPPRALLRGGQGAQELGALVCCGRRLEVLQGPPAVPDHKLPPHALGEQRAHLHGPRHGVHLADRPHQEVPGRGLRLEGRAIDCHHAAHLHALPLACFHAIAEIHEVEEGAGDLPALQRDLCHDARRPGAAPRDGEALADLAAALRDEGLDLYAPAHREADELRVRLLHLPLPHNVVVLVDVNARLGRGKCDPRLRLPPAGREPPDLGGGRVCVVQAGERLHHPRHDGGRHEHEVRHLRRPGLPARQGDLDALGPGEGGGVAVGEVVRGELEGLELYTGQTPDGDAESGPQLNLGGPPLPGALVQGPCHPVARAAYDGLE
mmetsp:Transcript_28347/g.90317  ORF Transcript_28347/g.90317 Transcript_28347/m.90317 type:complete len:375 (-) Transcript_28347:412-1536(-)